MPDYAYRGPADIDRAIAFLIKLDEHQRNALAVLQIDDAIEEAQKEYESPSATPPTTVRRLHRAPQRLPGHGRRRREPQALLATMPDTAQSFIAAASALADPERAVDLQRYFRPVR